jgi:phage terminase small subunit
LEVSPAPTHAIVSFVQPVQKLRISQMANPRIPDNVKVLHGTFRKSRAAPAHLEMSSLTAAPAPPDWLPNGHAVREWNRVSPILVAYKLLPEASISSLGHYCALHGRLVQLWAAGEVPQASLLAQHRAMAGELALTAVSAQKIKPRSSDSPDRNPFADIQEGPPK